jgi:type IV secretory pathway VirB10-like protein
MNKGRVKKVIVEKEETLSLKKTSTKNNDRNRVDEAVKGSELAHDDRKESQVEQPEESQSEEANKKDLNQEPTVIGQKAKAPKRPRKIRRGGLCKCLLTTVTCLKRKLKTTK